MEVSPVVRRVELPVLVPPVPMPPGVGVGVGVGAVDGGGVGTHVPGWHSGRVSLTPQTSPKAASVPDDVDNPPPPPAQAARVTVDANRASKETERIMTIHEMTLAGKNGLIALILR